MGRLLHEMRHRSDGSAKNSEQKETKREEFNLSMKKTVQVEVQDVRAEGVHLERRFSPRLANIPKEKQPFYGSSTRRHLSASKDEGYCRKTDYDDLKKQFQYAIDDLPSKKAEVDIDAKRTHLFVQRVSPRLKNIPLDKRPYYGSVQRTKLSACKDDECNGKTQDNDFRRLNSFKEDIVCEKAKDETIMTKNDGQLVQKLISHFKRQISPRHDQKRKRDATIGDLRCRKHEEDDCMRVRHSPDDNATKEKTEVGRSMQLCQLNMARTDVEVRGTENCLTHDFVSMEHNSTAIVALEDEAYLNFTGHKSFLADSVHPRSVASVKATVLKSTCKDNNNCSHNYNKIENEMLDVTLCKNAVQNSQKIGLSGSPLERRVSPRLQNIPVSKRPFYGSNKKAKLSVDNDNISNNNDRNRHSTFPNDRTPINDNTCYKNNQNWQLSFPKDKITIENSNVGHIIKELLPNVARKDIGDRDTINMLDAGSGTVKYGKREIVDVENYVSPKPWDCKRFSANQMCEKVDVTMKGTVRTLDKHHPSVVQGRAAKDFSELPGLVCKDISYGKESMPIPATNLIDPPTAPSKSGFKYIKTIKTGKGVLIPPSSPGCNCKGNCTNPKYCSCARLNGSDFPYVNKDGGRLIEPKDVVFECGPRCGCGPNCVNRTSQRGLKYQFEVYRTMNKGWAVRSWDFIPSGAFVCEYIGVIRKTSELDNDNVSENDFIFQIDCWHTMKGIGGRERRQGDVSKHARSLVDKVDEAESETEFCVDGVEFGNVTRFINHSCDPNLFVQCVLSSHRDIRLARIVLFAADDIPPMQELTYDYGYELDSVIGPDGKIKKLPCYCGTSECRGRLY